MSKQEKLLRAKLQRQEAEDASEEGSDEQEEETAWGRGKKAYYADQQVWSNQATCCWQQGGMQHYQQRTQCRHGVQSSHCAGFANS